MREKQIVKTRSPSSSIHGEQWITIEIPAIYENRVIAPAQPTLDDKQLDSLIDELKKSDALLTIEDIQNYSEK